MDILITLLFYPTYEWINVALWGSLASFDVRDVGTQVQILAGPPILTFFMMAASRQFQWENMLSL